MMKRILLILSIAAGLTIAGGCGSDDSGHSHGEGADHTHETEQHAHDDVNADHQHETQQDHEHSGGEGEHSHSDEDAHTHEGEDSGTMLGLDETYDEVRKGVHLILSYSSETSSFIGTVENTTEEALPQVSVGIQLSNGTELGPTTPVDLDAGENQSIELDAAGETFDSWSALSKIGSSGHSHGEDGDHEH